MNKQATKQNSSSNTPRFTALLDRVVAALPRGRLGHPDLKPIVDHLGKNHAQVYEWLITRNVLANGEVTLGMLEWTLEAEAAQAAAQPEPAAETAGKKLQRKR